MTFLLGLPPTAQADTALAVPLEQAATEQFEQPAPPAPADFVAPPLTGKIWRLEELAGEPWPDEENAPHLLLTDSGNLVGFGGCNYFIGKFRSGETGSIVVSSLRASYQQCPKSAKAEATLLTSLVMANTLLAADGRLTFLMSGSNLMKFARAPEISVEELVQQGKLVKAKASKKYRHKKKKVASKATKRHKKAAPKTTSKTGKVKRKPGKTKPVKTKPVKKK